MTNLWFPENQAWNMKKKIVNTLEDKIHGFIEQAAASFMVENKIKNIFFKENWQKQTFYHHFYLSIS